MTSPPTPDDTTKIDVSEVMVESHGDGVPSESVESVVTMEDREISVASEDPDTGGAFEVSSPTGIDGNLGTIPPVPPVISRVERMRIARASGSKGGSSAVTGQYLPALDGLRALAVAGVVAYHLGLHWISGGYLGVDLFFVLSGFLITTLLLEEWVANARIRLSAFWARRARRLLPALFLVILAIALFVVIDGHFGAPGADAQINLPGLRGDALATLLYVANWHSIFAHQPYFANFTAQSPLEHTWSLAIEEQFYVLWPLLLLVILRLGRHAWRHVGTVVTVVGALISALLMAVLYHAGTDPTRVYFGTDTHMFDMLAGATVAMLVASRPQPGPRARAMLHIASPFAAVGLGVFWVLGGSATAHHLQTGLAQPKSWMFRGGFLLCAALAAVVISDVRQLHQGPLGVVLSLQPLRWLGKISYGIYLWHWPIIIYFTATRTGIHGIALDLCRIGLTLGISTVSFYLLEQPIRRFRMKAWPRFALAPIAAVFTAAVVVVATVPSVAVATTKAPMTKAAVVGGPQVIPGSGGFSSQTPLNLPAFSASNPLRVTVFGDSFSKDAEPGIAAAFGATGEVTVTDGAATGYGLNRTLPNYTWKKDIPTYIASLHTQVVLATWSWDDTCTPGEATYETYTCALQRPTAFKQMLETAVHLMLGPGGASDVVFMQFPATGPIPFLTAGEQKIEDATRDAGEAAFDRIAGSLSSVFPGQVMYLPVGTSVLLKGAFTSWLPPAGQPRTPKSDWVRVRMFDDVHLCPAGVVRYADALLTDFTTLFHLGKAAPGWSTQSWVNDPRYNTPAGSCPNDHPPG